MVNLRAYRAEPVVSVESVSESAVTATATAAAVSIAAPTAVAVSITAVTNVCVAPSVKSEAKTGADRAGSAAGAVAADGTCGRRAYAGDKPYGALADPGKQTGKA